MQSSDLSHLGDSSWPFKPHNPTLRELLKHQNRLLTCTPDTSVATVAAKMNAIGVSAMVVVDEAQRPVGIWTEHDALRIDFHHGGLHYQQPISNLMSQPVQTIPDTARLNETARLFRQQHIRHVLVTSDKSQIQGIITQSDLVLHQGIEHYLHFRTVDCITPQDTGRLPESAPLSAATATMRSFRADAILVEYETGDLGILTERDLIRLIATQTPDSPIGTVATRGVISVDQKTSLYKVRELMRDRQIRHLAVMADGQIIGLINFSDLLSGMELAYIDELRCALQERDKALSQSRQNLHLAENIIASSMEGIMITDAQGLILQVNPAFTELTGYHCEDVVGRSPSILSSGRQDSEFYAQMWRVLNSEGRWRGEIWNRRKNGEIYPELLTITAIYDDQKQITHYAALFSDITSLKENERRIEHLAYYDPLTHLANRRLFNDRLNQALAQAQRNELTLAILFIDLDRFKQINDSLGHQIGDELLCELAERIKSCVRDEDTVARTGGDEFLVLLSHVNKPSEVVYITERILAVASKAVTLHEHQLNISASIGVALFPEDGTDADTLIKHADTALYRAKAQGRNTYRLFKPSMNKAAMYHLKLDQSLRQALEHKEISVVYQPIADAKTNQIIGAEALARWHHPELGTISPAEFIPLAEENGQIIPMGRFIFNRVVHQAAEWACKLPIAVNLSARQFNDPHLGKHITHLLAKAGVPAPLITLELTESLLQGNVPRHIEQMQALHSAGFNLSIDDFGTGYSSLAYLRRFPLNTLKIDQSFVRDMAESSDAHAIVRAIITLGQTLGLHTVAEGVETIEQQNLLAELGCSKLQGYLIGQPVAPEIFERLYLQASE